MATLKFKLRNESDNSNIYVYYSISQKVRLWRKTGFVINFKDWNADKEQSRLRDDDAKKLNIKTMLRNPNMNFRKYRTIFIFAKPLVKRIYV